MFGKWSAAEAVEAVPGAFRRTLAYGDRMLLVEWQIFPGAGIPLHQHHFEQIGYLVSGTLAMTIGEETHLLAPGDGYLAPAGVPHSAIAHDECRIVDVFAPVREEYK